METIGGQATAAHPSRGSASRRRAVRSLVALCGAVALLSAAACSSSSSGGGQKSFSAKNPVTLTFANWADSEQATRPGIEAMIKQFESTHPGIKIKSEPISFTDIGHTLLLRQQSGNTPDVAQLSGNDTISIAATGALASLDSYVTGSVKSSLIPSELQLGMYQGKLIALPWMINPPALWYNKKLMAGAGLDPSKPPATIDELTSDLEKIHAKYPSVIPFGVDTTNRAFALTADWPWMKAFGAEPFNGTNATADTPQMKAYLAWMQDLAKKGLISAGKKIGEFRPLAAQDKVAFMWDQPVMQGVAQKANKQTDAQFYANWGVAPQPTGSSGKPYSVELGHQLVVFNKAKNKDAAFQFIDWLATNDQVITNFLVKDESSLPVLANPDPTVAKAIDTPVLKAFSDQVLPTVTPLPFGPTFNEAYSPIMAGVQQAVTSSASPDSIAKTIQSGLESAFK